MATDHRGRIVGNPYTLHGGHASSPLKGIGSALRNALDYSILSEGDPSVDERNLVSPKEHARRTTPDEHGMLESDWIVGAIGNAMENTPGIERIK